jgi:hypothetical protein
MLREHLSIAAIGLLFALSLFGWGELPFLLVRRSIQTFWARLAARFVLGCGTFYILVLALSLLGRMHRIEVGIVMLAGVGLACLGLYGIGSEAAIVISDLKSWDLWDQALLGLIGLFVFVQLALGLTPLVFYDLQAYHLFAPAQFLISGGLTPIPWHVQTNSPLTVQLIVGTTLALDVSGQVAKLAFTAIGCFLAVGIYTLILPAGRRAALLATLCVLSFPEFWMMQTLGVVDLAVAAFLLLGVVWTRDALKSGTYGPALLAGVAFGLAAGSRYQAVILLAWALGVLIVEAMVAKPRPRLGRMGGQFVVMGSIAAALVAPWLVRNYVQLGNPVFPLMQSVWGVRGEWSEEQSRILNVDVLGKSIGDVAAVEVLIAPIMAFADSAPLKFLGAFLLVACLIAVVRAEKEIRLTALLGLGGLLIWSMVRPEGGFPILRFNALSIVFMLAATGAVLGSGRLLPRAGAAVALTFVGASVVIGAVHVQSILPAAQSLASSDLRESMYRGSVPSWEAFDYINKNLKPEQDKVLLIGETRGFWLRVPAVVPSAYNGPQLVELFGGNPTPDAWRQVLAAMGITHLLVHPPEIERLRRMYGYFSLSKSDEERLYEWLRSLPKKFDDGRGTFVLALN